MVRSCLLLLVVLSASESVGQYYYTPPRDYYRNDTAEGTVAGGAFGAIAGALIGSSNGESPEGALIGAGVGALTGNLLGRSKDAADRQQAAYGYAATNQANARAAAYALTNADLIQMSRAGIDQSVILNAIQTRGGRFDLSPSGLIQLKEAGVSDSLVLAAQRGAAPPPETVIVQPTPVYHYRPGPRMHFHYGRPRYYRHW